MKIIKDLYELTTTEKKDSTIRQIRKLRQDELNHLICALDLFRTTSKSSLHLKRCTKIRENICTY